MALGLFLLYLAFCFYAPWLALFTGTIAILLVLLALLCNGGIWLLEKAAKALPACWLFDGPVQNHAMQTPLPAKTQRVEWDYRDDNTDYPSGRH